MKLLFLTDNFPPEVNAPATRTFEHCREWVINGMEVTVITCAPNFPQGKLFDGYRNRLWQEEMIAGIRVIRVWSFMAENSGFIRRILDYVSFAIMGTIAALFVRTDVIVATSPQFFTAAAGYVSGLLKRKPWVFEVRDLWPESIKAVGAAQGKDIFLVWMARVERFLYRKANLIVVVTESFKEKLTKRGINPAKIEVVFNGVLLDQFKELPAEAARIRAELGLADKFVVGYLGTHGMAHNLDFILDCLPAVPDTIHFLFIGSGSQKQALVERWQKEKLNNLTMLPLIPKQEIQAYLSVFDAALVPLRRSNTFKTVIPSKIFESAAMRKPILLGVEGESQAIVEKYDVGLPFIPEDREDFLSKLKLLATDQLLYAKKQANCLSLAKEYDRKRLASSMLKLLKSIK